MNGKHYVSDWNDDVYQADQYLQDIKMAYSFRVQDTKIVNELQELLGCSADNIIKRVKQLDIALDNACFALVLNDLKSTVSRKKCYELGQKGKAKLLKESEEK